MDHSLELEDSAALVVVAEAFRLLDPYPRRRLGIDFSIVLSRISQRAVQLDTASH